jgi:uncharacterized membrane protein required for colicin V production
MCLERKVFLSAFFVAKYFLNKMCQALSKQLEKEGFREFPLFILFFFISGHIHLSVVTN